MMTSTMRTRNIRRAAFAVLLALAAAALAGCQTTGEGPMAQAAAPAAPLTHQQAALQCWMETEKDAAKLGLDKRADVVTKCIADKTGVKQTADATPGPKGDAKPAPAMPQPAKPAKP
jgi:hypothetical protein